MEPKDYFKKTILGQLTTRTIDKLSLEGVPSSIEEEKEYDVIDVINQEGHKMFVTNVWEDEENNMVLAIHNNFVKETNFGERITREDVVNDKQNIRTSRQQNKTTM